MEADLHAPKWTLRAMLFGLVFTGLLFVLLPMTERVSRLPEPDLTLRELQTLPPPLKPPPPLEVPPEASEPMLESLPIPELQERLPPAPPLQLPVDLRPSPAGIKGVVGQQFQVQGDLQNAGVQQGIFEISDLDRPPRPLVRLNPVYPPGARMRRIEGYVTVEFVVSVQGETGDLVVVASAPGDLFVNSVERAVRAWRFEPGEMGGKAVASRIRQRIDFTID